MIELVQQENNIIGSADDIKRLADKNHARIIAASDSHGNTDVLLNILRQFGPACDGFAFCGDGLSDIIRILLYAEENQEIRKILPPVMAIAGGNCDPSYYPLSENSQIKAPGRQILTVNNHNILIVHGHNESINFGLNVINLKMQEENCNTALFGHTHIAEEIYSNGHKLINPGSCSIPRGSQPPGFAILTVEKDFIDVAFLKIEMHNKEYNYKIWQPD